MIERMAIISNGPSAECFFEDRRGYDLVVGCRSIPSRVVCDWWCVADATGFQKGPEPLTGKDAIKICTRSNVPGKLKERSADDYKRFIESDHLFIDRAITPKIPENFADLWFVYSGVMALGLALMLKPVTLDLFGYDMKGALDAEGNDDAKNRTESHRWKQERMIFAYMTQSIDNHGIQCQRIEAKAVAAHG